MIPINQPSYKSEHVTLIHNLYQLKIFNAYQAYSLKLC